MNGHDLTEIQLEFLFSLLDGPRAIHYSEDRSLRDLYRKGYTSHDHHAEGEAFWFEHLNSFGRHALECWANRITFHAAPTDHGTWMVQDGYGGILYIDDDDLQEQEARDLAWAWNNGAESDEEAVKMNVDRRGGKRPKWLLKSYYEMHHSP